MIYRVEDMKGSPFHGTRKFYAGSKDKVPWRLWPRDGLKFDTKHLAETFALTHLGETSEWIGKLRVTWTVG